MEHDSESHASDSRVVGSRITSSASLIGAICRWVRSGRGLFLVRLYPRPVARHLLFLSRRYHRDPTSGHDDLFQRTRRAFGKTVVDVHTHKELAVDASSVSEGLTSGDWLGIIGVMAALAGTLGMIIFNMVMKRLDKIDARSIAQGKTLTAICTKLGVAEAAIEE